MAKNGGGGDSAGMDKTELKRNLKFARDEPVQVAFALDGDNKVVLQMHRRKQGRALEKQLKEDAPDSKNHRWGTASIDPNDPKLVRFTVNKAGGGMARKLIVALKGTGFNKVKIQLEDGTELEADAGEDEAEAPDGMDASSPQDAGPASGPGAGAAADRDAAASPNGQEAAPNGSANGADPDGRQSGSGPDARAIVAQLAELTRQILPLVANDPLVRGQLKDLVTKAQAAVKGGDLDAASKTVGGLRDMLEQLGSQGAAAGAGSKGGTDGTANGGGEPAAPAQPAAHNAAPTIAKARTAWVATRKRIETDIDKLHGHFGSALKGHDKADQLTKTFRTRVDTVMDALDEALSDVLDAVNQASDPTERNRLVQQAQGQIKQYQAYIASDQTIAMLDKNPFAPIAISKTMSATLAALATAIR